MMRSSSSRTWTPTSSTRCAHATPATTTPTTQQTAGRADSARRPGPQPASRMTVQHIDWDDLGQPVRDLVQAPAGPVHGAQTVTAGLNSQLAVVLETATGPMFVKGLCTDHPGVVRQHREAMINPCVLPVAPRLRWQTKAPDGTSWPSTTSPAH